jgi:hypothetical protein
MIMEKPDEGSIEKRTAAGGAPPTTVLTNKGASTSLARF